MNQAASSARCAWRPSTQLSISPSLPRRTLLSASTCVCVCGRHEHLVHVSAAAWGPVQFPAALHDVPRSGRCCRAPKARDAHTCSVSAMDLPLLL